MATTAKVTRLIPVDADRPTLSVGAGLPIVFLGENDSTAIIDPKLSHKVIKIYEKRNKIWAFVLPDGYGYVKINGVGIAKGGRRELREGSRVTLCTGDEIDDGEYIYRVQQSDGPTPATADDSSDAAPAVATAPAAAAIPTPATPVTLPNNVAEQCMCAVCMEILVEPQTLVPCGHSFCKQCVPQSECPECRGKIKSTVVGRSLQNLIENLVDASGMPGVTIFDREDLEGYFKRTNKSAPTFPTPGASRKRRRAAVYSSSASAAQPSNQVLDLTF